ncbi:hypothetical protein N7468_006063 [Penicillium chermesinum]|uniref:Gamma-butyrobetaine dioxygenase n=1 Tax=Penicillium chermesinum TaxID=63820 RepID=A0A9W9TNU1_9EURO|nr:uncharacterized protein N7468_006063 [Penicillium chermesinum]KAJ5233107.1 hypothetical protein N7468_006063 [Penicillium chermesinum]
MRPFSAVLRNSLRGQSGQLRIPLAPGRVAIPRYNTVRLLSTSAEPEPAGRESTSTTQLGDHQGGIAPNSLPAGSRTTSHGIEVDFHGNNGFLTVHPNALHLKFRHGERPLSYFFLRDLCQCRVCKDPHSKQRNFRTSDIPLDIKPQKVEFNGKIVRLKWADDHVSEWGLSYLIRHMPKSNPPIRYKPYTWNAERMKEIQHWVSFDDYISDDKKFATAMKNLHFLGLIFVKDIPDSREMVEKIATRMGPVRDSFYGKTWDVRTVPEAKNVAYTSQFLGFHMDLMYMNEPPGYQLLHCLENSCDGGESLFTDTFFAARRFKDTPELYQALLDLKLSYEYDHDNHKYYQTRPGPLPTNPGKKWGLRMKALKQFEEFMAEETAMFELKLNPGECVIFNNRRIAHARRQFNTATGSRWLAGAYVDTDAVRSCIAVSQAHHGDVWKSRGGENKEGGKD